MLSVNRDYSIAYAETFLVVAAASWLVRRLFASGRLVKTVGEETHYPMRIAMRMVFFTFSLLGIFSVVTGLRHTLEGRLALGLLLVVLGAICQAGLLLQSAQIIVDSFGIRSRGFHSPETLIPWGDLSHFERQYNPRAFTSTFFIRGKSGLTIAADDTAFDTSSLMKQITARHPLQEKIYKRRRWYGG